MPPGPRPPGHVCLRLPLQRPRVTGQLSVQTPVQHFELMRLFVAGEEAALDVARVMDAALPFRVSVVWI